MQFFSDNEDGFGYGCGYGDGTTLQIGSGKGFNADISTDDGCGHSSLERRFDGRGYGEGAMLGAGNHNCGGNG